MKKFLQSIFIFWFALGLCLPSALALDPSKVVTEFDEVLYQIERYGLFAEDHELTDSQRAAYNARIKNGESLSKVVNEILAKHDTHSYYMTPEEYLKSFAALADNYVGVGITVRQLDGKTVISAVNYGGPAREAGVEAGDILAAVNGVSTEGKTLDEISGYLRGDAGTKVNLTLQRGAEEVKVTVTRREIFGDYVWSETMAEGVEYIKIEAFASKDDAEHFTAIWDGLDEKGTAAVILDLRGNGGGLIDAALTMLDSILREPSEIVTCRWRRDQGGPQTISSKGGGLPLNGIYVLVDNNTASAAEMMAACLKDTGTGVLVGETTFGKSQGQFHLTMGNGDSLVITTLEMSAPETGVWEGLGVTPDVETKSLITLGDALYGTPELPVARPLYLGETGTAVTALTERLRLLGLLETSGDTVTPEVIAAAREFQDIAEMKKSICVNVATLRMVDELCDAAAGYYVDNALQEALALAKEAAAQPLQYKTRQDGGWRAVA